MTLYYLLLGSFVKSFFGKGVGNRESGIGNRYADVGWAVDHTDSFVCHPLTTHCPPTEYLI
ncbi:hypothetical protein BJP34_03705 [Moorena producens PAL-8-15-08-1]|uniref:Uncharacterized protein n=1 Tax=Moorena producens PAL-8-15-08-1 TaxID=1458985 RepID=A0A1D8TM00_9CYAN|nr:hypothetical protein BJP34_03705 [Moorena producens PAL-8-15-08-1]